LDELDGTGAQILPMHYVKCHDTEDEANWFYLPKWSWSYINAKSNYSCRN